jgi:uncharacterized protein
MNPSLRLPRLALASAASALLLCGGAFAADPAAAPPPVSAAAIRERAIFAVSDDSPQKWNLTLGNIANAIEGLGADGAEIELVVYGPGIAMLKKDSPVTERLAAAVKAGVRVVACQNSMRGFKLAQADLAPGVDVVPSGVVELIRRQHAGYAYVRS